MEGNKMVRVVATGPGYDNITVRQPGDEFDMPASAFARRPRLDEKGKAIDGVFYDPPSWFKLKETAKPARQEVAAPTRDADDLA